MVIHNFRTVNETGYLMFCYGWKKVAMYQKLKSDLTVTIQSLTLSWVQSESLFKKNTVLKVKVALLAVCRHWFKLHVFHWVISPPVVNLTAGGGEWWHSWPAH